MKKNRKIPNTYVIIAAMIALCAIATWFVPGGQYVKAPDGSLSYESVPAVPQTWQVFSAVYHGFVKQAGIIVFILVVGGAFWLLNATGAVGAGISRFITVVGKRDKLVLLALTLLFSLAGAVFGMSEETIPFIGIVVPLVVSMGYDAFMGMLIVYVASNVGFSAAFLNPFTIGIAQGMADLPLFSGMGYRVFCWAFLTILLMVFVFVYARLTRTRPSISVSPFVTPNLSSSSASASSGTVDSSGVSASSGTVDSSSVSVSSGAIDSTSVSASSGTVDSPGASASSGAVDSSGASASSGAIDSSRASDSSRVVEPSSVSASSGTVDSSSASDSSDAFGSGASGAGSGASTPLSRRQGWILLVLLVTVVALIVGVTCWDWYMPEITGLFLAMGIVSGLIAGFPANRIAEELIAGAKDILSAALVVGFASGIIVILQDGKIVDSLLHAMQEGLDGTGSVSSLSAMYGIQALINFVIPSATAKAAITIPIMAPFSDMVGVSRQAMVLAFQFGDGFTNMITPTSGVLIAALAMARIPYADWVRWIWKGVLVLLVLGLLLLLPTALLSIPGF